VEQLLDRVKIVRRARVNVLRTVLTLGGLAVFVLLSLYWLFFLLLAFMGVLVGAGSWRDFLMAAGALATGDWRLVIVYGLSLYIVISAERRLRRWAFSRLFKKGGLERIRGQLARDPDEGMEDHELTLGDRRQVWRAYAAAEASPSEINRPMCYVNVVNKPHGTPGLAIQYWYFYFGDDFINFHLADWEMVTVFLRDSPSGHEPVSCTYSCHSNGRVRQWEDVQRLDGTHPLVYVALGSHANYFEAEPLGFTTGGGFNEVSWRLPALFKAYFRLKGVELGRSITVSTSIMQEDPQGTSRDFVPLVLYDQVKGQFRHLYDTEAAPPIVPVQAAEVRMFPYDVDADVVPINNNPVWDRWWWLRYQGLWGTGIKGPNYQGDRWHDPWQWSRKMGLPDMTPEWRGMHR
jgi:hypothetical protein